MILILTVDLYASVGDFNEFKAVLMKRNKGIVYSNANHCINYRDFKSLYN